jgi:hypothetical protein
MSDPQVCVDKLRKLADVGFGDPRKTAAKIVHKFVAGSSKSDVRQLCTRLEDTLVASRYTIVPLAYLDQQLRWLIVLESACAEAERHGQSPQRRVFLRRPQSRNEHYRTHNR